MAQPQPMTWRRFLTVEPVLLLYAYGFFMSIPLQRQYIYFRFSEAIGFPYGVGKEASSGCGAEGIGRNATLTKMENEVQELTTQFDTGSVLVQALPSLIMGLFIGPWTDTGGRKLAIMFPVIGAVQESLLLIGIMYFSWPINFVYVGKALNGMTGFFGAMIQASTSYIADTTEPSQIAFRLAVMQLLVFTGGFLSQLLSGVMLSAFGFIPPYLSILACTMVAFFYLTLFVPESLPQEKRSRQPLFTANSLKRVLQIFTKPRSGNRTNLLLLLLSDAVFCMIAMGSNGVMMLYLLRSPLCLTPTVMGFYVAFKFFMEGLGGILGIVILKRFLREESIIQVSVLSLACSMVVLAFVGRTDMVFLVPVISSLSGPFMPLLKGMMSKIIPPDEQGSLFTAISAVESLAMVLGAATLNSLYIASLEAGFPGLVFLACGLVLLVPMALVSFLQKPKEE